MRTRNIVVLIAVFMVLGICHNSLAQAPDTLWTRVYTIPYLNDVYSGTMIQETYDGGFIVIGSYSLLQGFVLKTDAFGEALWSSYLQIAYGSALNCVVCSPDSTIAIVGWADGMESGGPKSYSLIFDIYGNVVGWIPLPYFDTNYGYGAGWVDITPDSGFIVVDYPDNNIRVTRVNRDGSLAWNHQYSRSWSSTEGVIKNDLLGGFILAGGTPSPGHNDADAYLIRINSDGDTLWTRTYGGSGNDSFNEIVEAPDGGYMIIGETSSWGHGGYDIYLVRTNPVGDTIWTRTIGTNEGDGKGSIDIVPNGGYIISANLYDPERGSVNNIIRIDDNGNTLWTKVINPDVTTRGNSIITLPDNGYVLTGSIDGGDSLSRGLWIARLAPDLVGVEDSAPQIPRGIGLSQNYPNPFNSSTVLEFSLTEPTSANLSIYDISGRKVSALWKGSTNPGTYRITWDGKGSNGQPLSSGIYFCKLKTGNSEQTKKMVLLR